MDFERDPEKQAETSQPSPSDAQPTPDGVQAPVVLMGVQFWLLMFAVTMSIWLMALTATVLGTAIPSITSEFHSINDVGWYSAAYLIGSEHLPCAVWILRRLA
jgi:hypothetical protein